jgi:hypothetical protein
MAVPARLELATFGLGNRCSIRLSYGTGLECPRNGESNFTSSGIGLGFPEYTEAVAFLAGAPPHPSARLIISLRVCYRFRWMVVMVISMSVSMIMRMLVMVQPLMRAGTAWVLAEHQRLDRHRHRI